MTCEKIRLPSCDGENSLSVCMYAPQENVRALVQISHGMVDHMERYRGLAEYLCSAGIAVAGNDHLGHGETVKSPEDFGFFASEGGKDKVIDDLKTVNAFLKERFPGVPHILLGHSMGSFLARLYAVRYPDSIDGLIIHGTAGKNPLLGFGRLFVKLMKMIKGERHRSKFIKSLADGGYNKKFDKSEGDGAWLSRDAAAVADRPLDTRTSFDFTVSAYGDLFEMLSECNKKEWFASFPKDLPTLVISGECDPVGDFGRGVTFVHDGLAGSGLTDLTLKMYEGARHELFNETNKEEVFLYLSEWISRVARR